MDEVDLRILSALQDDGRLTNPELADRAALSPSQCSRRRLALEEVGVIQSYHAHLAPERIGLNIVVFVQVTLSAHSPANAQRFRELVASVEEVQEAYAMTGAADYQIKLVVPDLKALNRILNGVFLPHESVRQVQSSVALDCLKQTSKLPLGQLRGGSERA